MSALRLVGGHVVDPANGIDKVQDVGIVDNEVVSSDEINNHHYEEIDAKDLLIIPGIIDLHCHLNDLFDVSTRPIEEAVESGTTVALTPGAGNTLMAPALLGAEVDRGLPLHVGCLVGIPAILRGGTPVSEWVRYFQGQMSEKEEEANVSLNGFTNRCGQLAMGLKDHMGHFLLSRREIGQGAQLAGSAGLMLMSHCQSPAYAEHVIASAEGNPVLLTHSSAAGSGSHGDARQSLQRVLELRRQANVRLDFITAHLRPHQGRRDGILIEGDAQSMAYEAMAANRCDLLVSDGPCDATVKGFGDASENVPALMELVDQNVLTLSESVATMTRNPVHYLSEITGNDWWVSKLGHLGVGARANVTVIEPRTHTPKLTIVDGQVAAIEGRVRREAYGVGGWVSPAGIRDKLGVG